MPTQRVVARAFCAALLVAMGCSRLVRQADEPAAPRAAPAAAGAAQPAAPKAAAGHWSFLSFGAPKPEAPQVAVAPAGESLLDGLVTRALRAAGAMAVEAAKGAMYRSEDGSLMVSIPPGALTHNATVRFARIDTSALEAGGAGTPAVFVAVDWGGATFNPDAELVARVEVDDRFLRTLKQAAPGQSPDQLGLSSDGAGRWYLPVRVRADPMGREEAVSGTLIGSGSLVEAARLPVSTTKYLPANMITRYDPDPLPAEVKDTPLMKPRTATDPLIRRYPALPVAWYGDDDHHPVNELAADGCNPIKVRHTVIETLIGQPVFVNKAMVTCVLNPCVPTVGKGVVEAVRYNGAIEAGRLPPKALGERVHAKVDCSCAAAAAKR
ncbi:MAG: hypothetical protein JWM80_2864 [Cyanobacteria bacterium RYN_339]|nr:hypothetical protein [Cyanobacteria bacterium RYN_339]